MIAARSGGEPVLRDGLVALVKHVEHPAGVELGALAEPVTAVGLVGGGEIVGGGGGEVVLPACGVGKAKISHLQAGIDEVVGPAGVVDDVAVDGDGGGAVPFILAEIGFFEAEEVVARVLASEGGLNGESLGVASIMAKKEGENGTGLDLVDEAVAGNVAQQIETLFLVAADASDADHHTNNTRKAGDGELLDADGHLGIGIVGIDLESLFGVVASLQALMRGGDEGVVNQRNERCMKTAGVATGEEGVLVLAVRLDLSVAQGNDLIGEGLDPLANVVGHSDIAFRGEKAVVSVVSRVEEVLMVELAEDHDLEDVGGSEGIVGVGALDGFKAGKSAVIVEVVEILVRLADLRKQIDRICMGGAGLCGQTRRKKGAGKEEAGEHEETKERAVGWNTLHPLRLDVRRWQEVPPSLPATA